MALPVQQLPKYKLTLPASGKVVQYRPFTVRESKILLLAIEEGKPDNITTALEQIIELCTFKKCKLNDLIQVDAEYLFIWIRNKSMGEGIDVVHNCTSCDKKNEIQLNMEEIQVIKGDGITDPNLKLADDVIVTVSYPSINKTIAIVEGEDPLVATAKCIESIMIGEKVYTHTDMTVPEIVAWLEGLTQVQLDMFEQFFKTMPKIVYERTYECPKCKAQNHIHIEGLANFFG